MSTGEGSCAIQWRRYRRCRRCSRIRARRGVPTRPPLPGKKIHSRIFFFTKDSAGAQIQNLNVNKSAAPSCQLREEHERDSQARLPEAGRVPSTREWQPPLLQEPQPWCRPSCGRNSMTVLNFWTFCAPNRNLIPDWFFRLFFRLFCRLIFYLIFRWSVSCFNFYINNPIVTNPLQSSTIVIYNLQELQRLKLHQILKTIFYLFTFDLKIKKLNHKQKQKNLK